MAIKYSVQQLVDDAAADNGVINIDFTAGECSIRYEGDEPDIYIIQYFKLISGRWELINCEALYTHELKPLDNLPTPA